MTQIDERIRMEEELRRRVARGEERDLHTTTDFKAAAEKTAREARRRAPTRRKTVSRPEI